MKLIIDIPNEAYKYTKTTSELGWLTTSEYANAIKNGIPLDDVKAEIRKKHLSIIEKNDFDNGRTYGYDECLSILDNIAKESEDKK